MTSGFKLAELFPDYLDGSFDFCFVFGVSRPGRADEHTILLGHFSKGAVEPGLVEVWFDDAGFKVIDDEALRHTIVELKPCSSGICRPRAQPTR